MLEQKALLKCSIHSLREPPAPCLSPRHTCELQTGSFITLTSETLASKVLFCPGNPERGFQGGVWEGSAFSGSSLHT